MVIAGLPFPIPDNDGHYNLPSAPCSYPPINTRWGPAAAVDTSTLSNCETVATVSFTLKLQTAFTD